jgi:hypothetical protein
MRKDAIEAPVIPKICGPFDFTQSLSCAQPEGAGSFGGHPDTFISLRQSGAAPSRSPRRTGQRLDAQRQAPDGPTSIQPASSSTFIIFSFKRRQASVGSAAPVTAEHTATRWAPARRTCSTLSMVMPPMAT